MKTMMMAAAVAAMALPAAGAWAQSSRSTTAGPSQPIPYSQLEAYSQASPRERASRDWWSGSTAATDASANASATTAATTPAKPRKDDKRVVGSASGDVSSPAAGEPAQQSPGSPAGPSGEANTGPQQPAGAAQ